MKIENTKSTATSSLGKIGKKKATSSASSFSLDNVAQNVSSSSATAVSALYDVSAAQALEALQGVEYDEPGQNVKHGHAILNMLDVLRQEVLMGDVSLKRLEEIEKSVGHHKSKTLDPQLIEILDEIDLRAKVEKAKYEV